MQLECEDPNKITLEQRENKVNQHNPMCTMLRSPSPNLMPLPCQAKFLGMGSPPICQGRTKKNIKQAYLPTQPPSRKKSNLQYWGSCGYLQNTYAGHEINNNP